jgi:hypothetical protein
MNEKVRAKAVRGTAARMILRQHAVLGGDAWFPGDPREWHITMIEWKT